MFGIHLHTGRSNVSMYADRHRRHAHIHRAESSGRILPFRTDFAFVVRRAIHRFFVCARDISFWGGKSLFHQRHGQRRSSAPSRRMDGWMDGRTNGRRFFTSSTTIIHSILQNTYTIVMRKHWSECQTIEIIKSMRVRQSETHRHAEMVQNKREGFSHARQRFSTWLTRNLCCFFFLLLFFCLHRISFAVYSYESCANIRRCRLCRRSKMNGEMFIFVILIYRAFLYFLHSSRISQFLRSNFAFGISALLRIHWLMFGSARTQIFARAVWGMANVRSLAPISGAHTNCDCNR